MNYKTKSNHIDLSRGRVQVSPKRLDIGMIYLGIHRNSNKPTNVEYGLDKVRVLG
jgi:hypothetical protein